VSSTPEEHPFAEYVRILARGKSKSRPLSEDEAFTAMRLILAGEVEDLQLGAFLMLMRHKEETPEEVAGFVRACRESLVLPESPPQVDIDWSSYAGKRRQLPWFLLAALALAASGLRIFMHGSSGHTAGRLYTAPALEALGLPIADSLPTAAGQLAENGFAYLPLEGLNPVLHRIIGLKPLLGLRSPVHTIARMLNPFAADCLLQGVFHPGYLDIHRGAAALLEQPRMAVIRGEGGEIECRPSKPMAVKSLSGGRLQEEEWPPLLAEARQPHDEALDPGRLVALWRGKIEDEYGTAAVVGTMALALRTIGQADDPVAALEQARALWAARDMGQLGAAA
jgi:anthranilate phosphoribosyltransferase